MYDGSKPAAGFTPLVAYSALRLSTAMESPMMRIGGPSEGSLGGAG